MDITNELINDVTVLKLGGRFDAYAAPAVEKFLQKTMGDGRPRNLIVNLAQVNFVDSTALATLVIGMKHYRQQQGELLLCHLQQTVRIIFELTRLDSIFAIYATQEEALERAQQSLSEKN
ncbi:anti-sigma factor antagonist [Dictyobacter vulcani]|uniref:Anti-sigma factor antagonist n=1 Tax=Dictyobacter vulcani TaxID=2607529 RepID=A0A5J4KV57_9CHLR|nr:STAS domain-containing protein [Dictyobacter vulcani]GER89056.1 anti-sigma factor antagonist [Dictyobacter vulcani]